MGWFVRLRSAPLVDEDRHAFQQWFDGDPAHRAAFAEVEALWDELGRLPDPRDDDAVRAAARSRRGPRTRRYGALAASLALALVAGLWAVVGFDGLRADYVTAVGEAKAVMLADGSVVHLGTDTALAVDLADDGRRLELFRGEAFFEVSADADRPFEVSAEGGLARALGTEFGVRNVDGGVTVAVEGGRVGVSRGPVPEAAGSVILGAGDAARYAATGAISPERLDVDIFTAWRDGKLVFADRPLRDVIGELDRYRRGRIVFLDSAIARRRFTGVFALGDTDEALDAIERTLPVEVVRITGYLTLLRAR